MAIPLEPMSRSSYLASRKNICAFVAAMAYGLAALLTVVHGPFKSAACSRALPPCQLIWSPFPDGKICKTEGGTFVVLMTGSPESAEAIPPAFGSTPVAFTVESSESADATSASVLAHPSKSTNARILGEDLRGLICYTTTLNHEPSTPLSHGPPLTQRKPSRLTAWTGGSFQR